jgi:predicted nucleotidyltransferase
MESEIINIWQLLYTYDVHYLTIGGFAVNYYGYNRSTGDIDLLIEDSLDNRKKLRKVLEKLGIGDFEEIESIQFLPGWTDFSLNTGLRLDIMTSIKGLETTPFSILYEQAEVIQIHGVQVRFIDYNHLIIAKKATNRPKDIDDIEHLERIQKWNNPK